MTQSLPKDAFAAECRKRGFILETVAANSPAELADSAVSLMIRPIDAVTQISDNMTSAGFTAITKAARQSRKQCKQSFRSCVPRKSQSCAGPRVRQGGRSRARRP